MEHNLTVDVHASWSDLPPSYRVYVDSDLLTERDFVWDGHNTYIKEIIVVNLQPGQHTLTVEQITPHGQIRTKNATLNNNAIGTSFTT